MVIGIPQEIQDFLDINDPKYHEAYARGYEAAKKEMLEKLKEMEPFSTATSTVSNNYAKTKS